VRETIVLLPWWPFSAEVFGTLPFYKALLEVLGQRFDVSVTDHPWILGRRSAAPAPRTIDELAAAFAPCVTADAHLVATGGTGIFALLATSRYPPQVRTFVFDSFPVPPATLSALGMSGLADLAAVALHVDPAGLRELLPLAMPGSSPTEIGALMSRVRPTVDFEYCDDVFELAQDVNLLEVGIVLPTSTLFLDNPVAFPGLLDRRMARKLFPNVRVQTREASDVMDAEKGTRFGEQVLDFVSGRLRA
jgi:pimeloyl-ACP methyl ester carboxylesterase